MIEDCVEGDVVGEADMCELPESSQPMSDRDVVFLKNGVISRKYFTGNKFIKTLL